MPVWTVTQSCLTPVSLWTAASQASLSMGERAPEFLIFLPPLGVATNEYILGN